MSYFIHICALRTKKLPLLPSRWVFALSPFSCNCTYFRLLKRVQGHRMHFLAFGICSYFFNMWNNLVINPVIRGDLMRWCNIKYCNTSTCIVKRQIIINKVHFSLFILEYFFFFKPQFIVLNTKESVHTPESK